MADEQEIVLSEDDILGHLKSIRPLTPDQWLERQTAAQENVKKSLGQKPTKEDFKREGKRKLGPLEWMMLALLALLFCFSILHVFTWARNQAILSYQTMHPAVEGVEEAPAQSGFSLGADGVTIGEDWYVFLHQLSVLGVTELGMVVLSIWHIYRAKFGGLSERPASRIGTVIWFLQRYFFMILAAACGLVVLGANLSSGFDPVVSFLVPILTISLSEIFARIAAESYNETLEIDLDYLEADRQWREYRQSPTNHPDYPKILNHEIQSWYRKNNAYRNIPWTPVLLRYLSAREKAANQRSANDDELVMRFAALAGSPLSAAAALSSGSSQTEPQSSLPMPSAPSSLEPAYPLPIPSTSNGQHDPNQNH